MQQLLTIQNTKPEKPHSVPANFYSNKEKREVGKGIYHNRIQPQLTLGAPDDIYEKEADDVASKIMRMPEQNFVQRKCAECEEEDKKKIQRKPLVENITPFIQTKSNGESSVSDSLSSSIHSSRGNGSSLDSSTQSFMESRFGADFSSVKIHSCGKAIQMNKELNAQAFTVGSDIYFNEGKYEPTTSEGKQLLAHELTHVVQQGGHQRIQRDLKEENEFLKTAPPVYTPKSLFPSDEEFAEYRAAKKLYGDQLREVAMAPLLRPHPDPIGFSNRLRSLTLQQSNMLVADDDFFKQVRRLFKGKSLWSIFTILFFNNRLHEPYLRLNYGIMHDDAQLTADMLSIVISTTKDDRYYAFLKEVVQVVFKSSPMLNEIIRLIDHRTDAGISQSLSGSYEEVHYEQDAAKKWSLTHFSGSFSANTYFTGKQFRVIVRMHFVDGGDEKNCPDANSTGCNAFLFLGNYDAVYRKWQSAITKHWNNKFTISNGKESFDMVFVPLFMTEQGNSVINVRVMTDKTKKCNKDFSAGRANQTCWYLDEDDATVAHEFGHSIGASDEYNLPGSYKEVKDAGFKLSDKDLKLTTVEGIRGFTKNKIEGGWGIKDSLMSRLSDEPQLRHLNRLLDLINAGLPPGVSPYKFQKK